jgi:hypothetical protein
MPTSNSPATLRNETILVSSDKCIEACVGGEVVIMDADNGFCFGLDATGSYVWEQLKAPITVHALVQRCRDRFDAVDGQIEADVVELLSQLLEKKLLSLGDPV